MLGGINKRHSLLVGILYQFRIYGFSCIHHTIRIIYGHLLQFCKSEFAAVFFEHISLDISEFDTLFKIGSEAIVQLLRE